MIDPAVATIRRLSLVCGIAAVVCVLAWPIAAFLAPGARPSAGKSVGPPSSASASASLTAARRCGKELETDPAEMIEEDREEWSYLSSCLASPSFPMPDESPAASSGRRPGNSARRLAIPLRC